MTNREPREPHIIPDPDTPTRCRRCTTPLTLTNTSDTDLALCFDCEAEEAMERPAPPPYPSDEELKAQHLNQALTFIQEALFEAGHSKVCTTPQYAQSVQRAADRKEALETCFLDWWSKNGADTFAFGNLSVIDKAKLAFFQGALAQAVLEREGDQ